MAAIVHCVRHGQAWHNIQDHDPSLVDPRLTSLGRRQCRTLRKSCKARESRIGLIAASPLCRTIQTALLAFYPETHDEIRRPRILALPDAQETSPLPCDVGLDVRELQELCNDRYWPVDLSLVKPGWNSKSDGSRFAPIHIALQERATDLRATLYREAQRLPLRNGRMPEIVLVSHGQFLHFLTEDWEHAAKYTGTGWENCEMRSYELRIDGSTAKRGPCLFETAKSRRKRGMTAKAPTQDLQGDMHLRALKDWYDQGAFSPNLSFREQGC